MEQAEKIKVAAVVGPTASGKTRLGVSLAKALGGEVISADSMQIYEGLDIASAKPSFDEMQGIPHHLISVIPRSRVFSVAQYVELAREKISEVHSRGRLPIIVGGTGLYVDSLLQNITFAEQETDEELRRELLQQAESDGGKSLWQELERIDPESARRIEPKNIRRVIRAIEIYRVTGRTMTQQLALSREAPSPYSAVKLGLKTRDRAVLYDRINRRVDEMVKMGLLDEARSELANETTGETAKKAIGCKELAPYFEGRMTLDEALEIMKRDTRRYAKRQLTWFLRDKSITWFNTDEYEDFADIEKEAAALAAERIKEPLNKSRSTN